VKKKANSFRTWVIWQLRRCSYMWAPRQQALREAQASRKDFKKNPGVAPASVTRRVRNFYSCAICKKVFPRKLVSVDHIKPVIDPKRGWQSWDEYIVRLFCQKEGFQIICSEDHNEKTQRERKIRQKYKEAA
jgi:hypothetical protein